MKEKLHDNAKLIIASSLRIMLNLTSFTENENEKREQVQILAVSTKTVFKVILHRQEYYK